MEDFEHFERTVSASNLECLDKVNDAKPNDIHESDEDSGPDVIFDTDSSDEAEGSVNDLSQAIKALKVSESKMFPLFKHCSINSFHMYR